MRGSVTHVFTASTAGAPMTSHTSIVATAGQGLAGDRYATDLAVGHYSDRAGADRHLTLVAQEGLDLANAELETPLAPGDARRNVVVTGIDLDALLGHRFRIGDVECRAVRTCPPCRYLDGLLGRRVLDALRDRAGIRAEVLTSGVIDVGAPIEAIAD